MRTVKLSNGLAHTSWFYGLGKGVFGYCVNLFRSEDLVHGVCGHGVCVRRGTDGWDRTGNNGMWERRSWTMVQFSRVKRGVWFQI